MLGKLNLKEIWIEDVVNFGEKNKVLAVVGSKKDLYEEEAVTYTDGEKFAKEYNAITVADMSQTAGLVDCNVGLSTFDFAVFVYGTSYYPLQFAREIFLPSAVIIRFCRMLCRSGICYHRRWNKTDSLNRCHFAVNQYGWFLLKYHDFDVLPDSGNLCQGIRLQELK